MGRVLLRLSGWGLVFALAMLFYLQPSASSPQTVPAQKAPPAEPINPARLQKGVVALDARLGGDEQKTRLVVDLSRKIEISAFTLADPYRVIVDLPDVSFDLPAAAGRLGRGLVTSYRYGLIGPGKARIVLDTRGPVAIDRSFVLAEFDDQPARLVIDLVASDRASMQKEGSTQKPVTVVAAPAPLATAPRPIEQNTPLAGDGGRPTIVIDPGHGGGDSGAHSANGDEEKAVVLAAAHRLREKLERLGRYRVVMTRTDDGFVSLADRVKIARDNQAALFISIHADFLSKREGDARGATVYTVSDQASDAEAARLAEKENKADLIAGMDLSAQSEDIVNILYDLTHRETKNFSSLFQRTLVAQMKAGGVLTHQDSMRSAGFVVLKAPDIPSVLVELGYLSNPEDTKNLISDAWRDKAADAMVTAVQAFFATRPAMAQTQVR
jgi:N-acetylmuramoyl-L-alanine amidase